MGTFSKKVAVMERVDSAKVLEETQRRYNNELETFYLSKAGTPHEGMPSYKKILKQVRAEESSKRLTKKA